MEQTPEAITRRIKAAFKNRTLPRADPVFQSRSSEVDMPTMVRLAHQTTWFDFPRDVVSRNPVALAFMTPEAFAWFLPAYLVVSVTRYAETDTLTTTILTCLTPPDDADASTFQALVDDMRALGADILEEDRVDSMGADEQLRQLFMARASVLADNEKAAVRQYLEYLDATHGADFPAFGPKQALERYWAKAVPSPNG